MWTAGQDFGGFGWERNKKVYRFVDDWIGEYNVRIADERQQPQTGLLLPEKLCLSAVCETYE